MSNIVMKAARLMDTLPQSEKEFAYEFIKKLVRAWGQDVTMLTPEEAAVLDRADESGFVDDEDIDGESIGTP